METLLSQTRRLLQRADEPRRVIAQNSGVGYGWLTKFAQGRIPDPGINKVQRVHDYLAEKEATAA